MEENSREVVEDRTDEAREPRGEKRSFDSSTNKETTEVKKVHWSTKPYTVISVDCPISRCDEQLPTEARLLMHLEKKHKVFENRCVAPRCAYSVRRLAKLHKHIKTIHKSIQSWKCLFCSEECDSWNELKYHNYANHERGSFKCRIEKCSFTHINRQPVVEHFNETHGSGIKKAQNAEKTAEPEQDSPGEQSPDEALNDEQSKV
ncbi:hypothetical protein TYRP_018553 [Tyrophagus putrescentiae]|nr:hypothetical protein TYRP_018553 [Tyrophagus putrescentiae]